MRPMPDLNTILGVTTAFAAYTWVAVQRAARGRSAPNQWAGIMPPSLTTREQWRSGHQAALPVMTAVALMLCAINIGLGLAAWGFGAKIAQAWGLLPLGE